MTQSVTVGIGRTLGLRIALAVKRKSGMLSATERNENKPKNPSRITLTRALIAIFLLCLILLWFFGVFLRRR